MRIARIWSSWNAAWRNDASDHVRRMRVVGSKPSAPHDRLQVRRRAVRRLQPLQQLACFKVVRVQLQRGLHLSRRARDILTSQQRHREVEVVVRIVGVGRHHLLKERHCVLALTARSHALIVHHLGQRQTARDKCEGRVRLSILCDVKAREAAIETRLQRHTVGRGDLRQRRCRRLILQRCILLLAQRQQRSRVVRRLGHRGLQPPQPLLGGLRRSPANVVLKRAEAHPAGRRKKGLLGHREVRVHALRHLPRNRILHVEEARQLARILQRLGHAQLVHLQYLRLHLDAPLRSHPSSQH
jgi:hypothetical protein